MKIFVSWSGATSRAFAKEVKWWLEQILFPIEPWMSDSDISPGDRSLVEIEEGLNGAQFGIICVTSENQTAPWLNFEAGAISKEVDGEKGKVVPLLIDMKRPTDLSQSTLSQFQAVVANREGFSKLAHAINVAAGPNQRSIESLNTAFETYWPQMEKRLATVSEGSAPRKPQRSTQDMVTEVLDIVRRLQRSQQVVNSEITTRRHMQEGRYNNSESLDENVLEDVETLANKSLFIMNSANHVRALSFDVSGSHIEVKLEYGPRPIKTEMKSIVSEVTKAFPAIDQVTILNAGGAILWSWDRSLL